MKDLQGQARPWIMLGCLFFCAIVSYTDREVLSLLVDFLKHDLHINDIQFAMLIGTFFGVIYAIAGLPTGWLIDRFPRRPFLIGAIVIWSTGTLLCGFAERFHAMLAARMMVAIGEAALSPVAISLIGDSFSPLLRGRALGIYFGGIVAGGGTSILFGSWLLDHSTLPGLATFLPVAQPWRRIFIILGLVGFLLAFLTAFLVREPVRAAPDHERQRDGVRDHVLRAPLYLAVALVSVIDNAVGAWAPYMFSHEFARTMNDVGRELGILLIVGGLAGVMLGGWVSDRATRTLSHAGVIRLLRIFLVLYGGLTSLFLVHNYVLLMVAVMGLVGFSGLITTVGLSALFNSLSSGRRGFAASLSFFLNVLIGVGVGPVLVPLIAHRMSAFDGSGTSLALFMTCGGMACLAALCLTGMLLRKPLRGDLRAESGM